MTFAISHIIANLPLLGNQELVLSSPNSSASQTTILIGKNGSGKSTLLREVLYLVRNEKDPYRRRGRQKQLIEALYAAVDGKITPFEYSSEKTETDNPDRSEKYESGLEKVIALSFTPFDKFPAIDDAERKELRSIGRSYPKTVEKPEYVYLGLKNSESRTSARGRLLKTVNQIVLKACSGLPVEGMKSVLDAIGYRSYLRITYRWSPSLVSRLLSEDHGRRDSPDNDGRVISSRREFEDRRRKAIDNLLRLHDISLKDYFGSGPHISRSSRQFEVTIDLGSSQIMKSIDVESELFAELANSGAILIDSVYLRSLKADEEIDLLDLSSGQLSIFTGFLGLGCHLTDNCLVMVDEPENSLHPAWQERYAGMVEEAFSRFKGCHFIIATHSPIILAGVANTRTTVVRMDALPTAISSDTVDGASSDANLVNAFEVITEGNAYIRQLFLELLTLVETGRSKDTRAQEVAKFLASHVRHIPANDPIRNAIVDTTQLVI